MEYKNEHTSAISFPLGGIGAGCIGLAGNGKLIDWEIFNCPNKFSFNGLSHFAVRAEKDGIVEDFRILHGDEPAPYTGGYTTTGEYQGYGWGPFEETLCNWPHFRNHVFHGNFPVAQIDFSGESFPAKPSLTAWSVFIPGDSKNTSLPAAFFEITLTATKSRDFTVIGVLDNPWAIEKNAYNCVKSNLLTVRRSPDTEDAVTLGIDAPSAMVSYQTESFRGYWRDHQEKYYHDVMAGGCFVDRPHQSADSDCPYRFGLLAAHFHLKKGERRTIRFVITWHSPICSNTWEQEDNRRAQAAGIPLTWRPWYTTVWTDSIASANYALQNLTNLREGTFRFMSALHDCSIPPEILNGISANLAVLKTPTCLRLEDGTFWGWEGIGIHRGSCPGSCIHVWNYTQALPYLFPDLERSMREANLTYGVDKHGGLHFRLKLPLGIHATPDDFRPCADGQFGEIMKFYRDWQISGDSLFLKKYWPTLKRILAYAWSSDNPDQWDPQQTGVLHGRQHHTLDMELFGPNVWMTAHYLGALKAMACMANAMHEPHFAEECNAIFERGRQFLETSGMFNGEFFTQKIDLANADVLTPFPDAQATYWDDDAKELKYQAGDGCMIDAPLAQWYATLYGLGELYSPTMNKKTLQAIYTYNFKSSMRNVCNLWRTYALNNEAGTLICTWPHGKRPAIPLSYHSECMTGFEWSVAAQLIHAGFVQQGESVATAIRRRFDGVRRNPWNEFECGNNYARSMASFGMMAAYAGSVVSATSLHFNPVHDGCYFWSNGTAWGTYNKKGKETTLRVLYGKLRLEKIELPYLKRTPVITYTPAKILKAGMEITVRDSAGRRSKRNSD